MILGSRQLQSELRSFYSNLNRSFLIFYSILGRFDDLSIQDQFKNRVGIRSRGVKQAPFQVLWNTTMPSVLIETGFMTNPEEEKKLNNKTHRVYMASAIFRAIRDYKAYLESNV